MTSTNGTISEGRRPGRAAYVAPRLRVFGDVATLTKFMTCSVSSNDGDAPCSMGQTKKTS